MRRAAVLLLAVAAALAFAGTAAASERHPTQGELENEVICPVCAPETIAQSDSPIAIRMRHVIAQRIAAGDTKSEIERLLVKNFGPSVLASPPRHGFSLLAWVLPLVGIAAGALAVAALAWRWSRRRESAAAPVAGASLNGRPLDPELERRLDEELARFEG
jgi:cytochrome c-type biogenesis protein CcmH/NrfF